MYLNKIQVREGYNDVDVTEQDQLHLVSVANNCEASKVCQS